MRSLPARERCRSRMERLVPKNYYLCKYLVFYPFNSYISIPSLLSALLFIAEFCRRNKKKGLNMKVITMESSLWIVLHNEKSVGTPTTEINTKRERCTSFAVFDPFISQDTTIEFQFLGVYFVITFVPCK